MKISTCCNIHIQHKTTKKTHLKYNHPSLTIAEKASIIITQKPRKSAQHVILLLSDNYYKKGMKETDARRKVTEGT